LHQPSVEPVKKRSNGFANLTPSTLAGTLLSLAGVRPIHFVLFFKSMNIYLVIIKTYLSRLEVGNTSSTVSGASEHEFLFVVKIKASQRFFMEAIALNIFFNKRILKE
jgi:hypothetical protein